MPTPVKLILNAASKSSESIAGWQAETFALTAAARGVGQEPVVLDIEPDAVLELELENGSILLVAAEDAERYLGRAIGRGEGAADEIQVGPALRLAGPHLPAGPSREGVGAWVLKSLRVFRQGPAGMTALAAAGTFQDYQLGNRSGLHRLATDQWRLTPIEQMSLASEPALLFLHGTASSTEGSFKDLWGGAKSEMDARTKLQEAYGDRIYGFEHRSLTESPIANVLELVNHLPVGARLHVVSHSRGGMLGELLARANRIGKEPFTETDIQRFLEHGERTGRKGYTEDARHLRELNLALKQRSLRIERFVRVAATARGTTLASGRLDRWASVMLNLFGKGMAAVPGLQPVAKGYDLLQNFLLAVVKERTDARVLPGLEAMMPDSPLVALLNAPDVEVDYPLHVIAGDYRGESLLSWLGDCLSEAFYGGETDLVVNTPSMSGGAPRKQDIWLKSVAGVKVTHFSYFERKESAQPLLEALAGKNDNFDRLAAPSRVELARGGKHPKPKADGPIALMLPGIMGSHLALQNDRIWFDPINMIAGEMARLRVDTGGVTADGWMDMSYESFAQHLAQSHEVRPFAYDWRLSIVAAAEEFGNVIDAAMDDAGKRGKPLRIVAHSMGGLVARLAMQGRWARFKAIPGSRLVQFGTPNHGSHSIAAVLLGRDAFVQKIERWFDWKHDMSEFLDIVRDFPGVLELLPWPLGDDGKAGDGLDYFDVRLWQEWHARDAENQRRGRGEEPDFERAKGAGDGWPVPLAERLQAAKAAIAVVQAAQLDPDCTLYVAGSERTPVAIRLLNGQVEIGWTERGDGRVPWDTGIPRDVKVWYTDAAHGDLLKHEAAFDDYVNLLETGNCRLPTSRGGARDAAGPQFAPARLEVHTLYPSAEEVMAAAVGGRPPRKRAKAPSLPVRVEIYNGSLAGADTPVLIGAYANDPIRGSAAFLDLHLGGNLKRAQKMGRYPDDPGEAIVFLQPTPGAKPGGAIVVGLGVLGELKPGALSRSLTHGFMEYARLWLEMHPSADTVPRGVDLSCVLVGTGYAGLSVELGMRSMAEALRHANQLLEQAGMGVRIASLCLFEEEEARVIAAAAALRELVADRKYADVLSYDCRIHLAQGRYRGHCLDQGGASGWQRVHITAGKEGGLRFTLLTERARNEVNDEPDQRQAVDGLIRSATTSTLDQPGLSRALFELMVPNGFKEALPDLRGLILGVDSVAAAYPWELMRDEAERYEQPLVTRLGVVRQLASPYGRRRVATVEEKRILVVGDTQSGFAELAGAQQEGRLVAGLLKDQGLDVNLLVRPDGQAVMVNLFDGHYRVIHLAAHGTVAEKEKEEQREAAEDKTKDKRRRYTGMVLGPDTFLTTAQVSKLRHVPELVFINCCHLGSMQADAQPRWGELAANLATEFIEMGCKAVIAAGWAVDDAAASTFAGAFYRAMLAGRKFGEAVLAARAETWRRHPNSNTWGAYQAYGDENFDLQAMLGQTGEEEAPRQAPIEQCSVSDYLHSGQIITDLDRLHARIGPASKEEKARYRKQLEQVESGARARFFQLAEVRERLAAAWADLGDKDRAIEHYSAALAQEQAGVSLHALEQLANLEIRLGHERMQQAESREQGEQLMNTGLQRLQALLALGKTAERLSLLGSYWKLRAKDQHHAGAKENVASALREMIAAYREASDLSQQGSGDRDYYATLNVIDGAILLAALDERSEFDALAPELGEWLAQVVRNGRRRYAEERTLFNAYAELEAARVAALCAMLDGRDAEALAQEKVRSDVAAGHRDLFKRLGNAREHESALKQLRWLIDLLPGKGGRKAMRVALQKLLAEIESA